MPEAGQKCSSAQEEPETEPTPRSKPLCSSKALPPSTCFPRSPGKHGGSQKGQACFWDHHSSNPQHVLFVPFIAFQSGALAGSMEVISMKSILCRQTGGGCFSPDHREVTSVKEQRPKNAARAEATALVTTNKWGHGQVPRPASRSGEIPDRMVKPSFLC